MSRRYVAATAAVLTLVVGGAAFAATRGTGPVVKTPGLDVWQPNVKVESTLHFAPGTIRVASGGTVTFHDSSNKDAHTITISPKAELPRSEDAPCKPCQVAAGHLKDPNNPDKGVKTYVLNKGPAGFDELGDSLVITPKGPHKTASIVVSAPAGTTLYFFCAIHQWMQGKIVVT